MFIRPRQWISVLKVFSSPRRCSGLGRRHFSPLRLEALEDRTLLTAGDLDPTFGMAGKVVTDFFGPVDAFASRVAIQSDGEIVVSGTTQSGVGPHLLVVARYNVDGSLDTRFGSQGEIITDLGTSGGIGTGGLAIQADGKIVVAVINYAQPSGTFLVLERFNSVGILDPNFGVGGKVTVGGFNSASGVAIQGDGKIVAVGMLANQGCTPALASHALTPTAALTAASASAGP